VEERIQSRSNLRELDESSVGHVYQVFERTWGSVEANLHSMELDVEVTASFPANLEVRIEDIFDTALREIQISDSSVDCQRNPVTTRVKGERVRPRFSVGQVFRPPVDAPLEAVEAALGPLVQAVSDVDRRRRSSIEPQLPVHLGDVKIGRRQFDLNIPVHENLANRDGHRDAVRVTGSFDRESAVSAGRDMGFEGPCVLPSRNQLSHRLQIPVGLPPAHADWRFFMPKVCMGPQPALEIVEGSPCARRRSDRRSAPDLRRPGVPREHRRQALTSKPRQFERQPSGPSGKPSRRSYAQRHLRHRIRPDSPPHLRTAPAVEREATY
jgi:hypothetical protein